MESNRTFPNSFYCPITSQLLKDPVLDPEGNTYEKEAIIHWLEKHGTSPITKNSLQVNSLVPNRALKEAMESILSNRSISITEPSQNGKQKPHSELTIEIVKKNNEMMLSVIPPNKREDQERAPAHICCVIDISASMGDEAKIQDKAGLYEGFGLSVLDIVKHAVKTIIQSLGDNDSLALVSFSTDAQVVLNLTKMNNIGKRKAITALEKLQPYEKTNIWEGLFSGFEVLRKGSIVKGNSVVFLLTDGQPNIIPAGGHQAKLEEYDGKYGLPGIINTFGFGYSLDSKLLNELSAIGNGAYAFIPDGSFVGTVFVNALSNLLATVACNVELAIELKLSGKEEFPMLKEYGYWIEKGSLKINLGSVIFEQAKRIVLPCETSEEKIQVNLEFISPFKEDYYVTEKQTVLVQGTEDLEIDVQKIRLSLVKDVSRAFEIMPYKDKDDEARELIENLIKKVQGSPLMDIQYVKDMLCDLEDQITKAFSDRKNFAKWGKHFIPSLIEAHLLQQCNNFKDPGVQYYGGELFAKIRNRIEEIFVKIPPPKGSIKRNEHRVLLDNMVKFYNAQGGCIAGDCIVLMADGGVKFIKDLRKGDEIMGSHDQAVKVTSVVKTVCQNNQAQLVKFDNGLKITAWHPIRLNGKFFFPCTAEEEMPFEYKFFECEAVYNFVLESDHLMTVNGVECVTLGHGFREDVVRHEYYGTSAIIDDLKRMEGWENGFVILSSEDIKRDKKIGRVVKLEKIKKPSGAMI